MLMTNLKGSLQQYVVPYNELNKTVSPRQDIITNNKNKVEGTPKEVNIFLGWDSKT